MDTNHAVSKNDCAKYLSIKISLNFLCNDNKYIFLLHTTFARSFTVSVFPVPAGPAGAPPRLKCMAPVSVR